METDIIKKISPNKIIELFENSDVVNIRSYEPLNTTTIQDYDKTITYKIRIRHNEEKDPKKLLNKALKRL